MPTAPAATVFELQVQDEPGGPWRTHLELQQVGFDANEQFVRYVYTQRHIAEMHLPGLKLSAHDARVREVPLDEANGPSVVIYSVL